MKKNPVYTIKQNEFSGKYVNTSIIVSAVFLIISVIARNAGGISRELVSHWIVAVNLLFFLFYLGVYVNRQSVSSDWHRSIYNFDVCTWCVYPVYMIFTVFTGVPDRAMPLYALLFFLVLGIKAYFLFLMPWSKGENSDTVVTGGKLFIMLLAVYLPFGYYYSARFDPTGDEPHYLLITHSMIHDFDIDISNNYNNEDYRIFVRGSLEPQPWEITKGERSYSYHSIGYSTFLIPGYLIGGRLGAVWQNQIMAAILSLLLFSCLKDAGLSNKTVYITWLIFALAPPLLVYSCLLYPEVLSACIAFYCYRLIVNKRKPAYREILLLMILLFIMPVMKIRYAPLVFLLFCTYVFKHFRARTVSVWIGAFAVITGFIYVLDRYMLGGILFLANYDPVNALREVVHVRSWLLVKAFTAFFLDQEFGLFWAAPVYVLILAGISSCWKSQHKLVLFITAGYLVFLIQLKKLGIHGLESPVPRYMVSILPFLAVVFAYGFKSMTERSRGTLLGWFASMTVLFTMARWCMHQGFSETADGSNDMFTQFNAAGMNHVQRFFPSLFRHQPEVIYTSIIAVVVIAVLVYFSKRMKNVQDNQPAQQPGLSVRPMLWGLVLAGLVFTGLHAMDKNIPLHTIEAEDMVHVGGNSFPVNMAWWKRDWQNWESIDPGWILYPGNSVTTNVNCSTPLNTITVAANCTGDSTQTPVLEIFLCNNKSGELPITEKQFMKPDNVEELFQKSIDNMDLIRALNHWGIYMHNVTENEQCHPVTIKLTANTINLEPIILNKIILQ